MRTFSESSDAPHLRRAIALAREHMLAGHGGPFGAVIAREGKILGEGWNQVATQNDPTAHAEVVAIRAATQAMGSWKLPGATLYTSCEPCPMCLAAAWWARVDRIVYAANRDAAAAAGFDDSALYAEVARPLSERHLPISHALADEGGTVFQEWLAKDDRVEY